MTVGRVVRDGVEQHADPARVRCLDERAEIVFRPVIQPGVEVVGHGVPEVAGERARDWGEPERGDAEVAQVVQSRGDGREPWLPEGARDDAIDDRALDPRAGYGRHRATAYAIAAISLHARAP